MMASRQWKYHVALIIPVVAVSAGLIGLAPSAAALEYPHAAVSPGQALTLVNQARARAGCAVLRLAPTLQTPAERQSRDQAVRDTFGHGGADGSTVDTRLSGLGYSRWGENVVQSQSAYGAVNFWANSPRHRANMLSCFFTHTGLAAARSNSGKLYWTQTFGG